MGLKNHNTMIRVCELWLWVWIMIKGGDLGEELDWWIDWWCSYCQDSKIGCIARICGIESD